MANKKQVTEEPKEVITTVTDPEAFNNETIVEFHLDRDPNDPRNAAPTPVLPSLND